MSFRRCYCYCLFTFCLLFSLVTSRLLAEDAPFDSSRFEITQLTSELVQPMELAVASDGTVFFIELGGKLKSFNPVDQKVVLVGEIKITTEQENGLIGLTLDPKFSDNHWVYLQYSPPDFSGQHISRFTLVDGKLDLESEKLLLKYEEQRKECCHHAGSLSFGPRDELFIASGDNKHPHGDSQGFAPIDERPEKAPWDAQKSAANTNSDNGKILRIRPLADGTYEIPDGNLFPKDGSRACPEIYCMGCRNPWRMTVDQETGFVYWGEVGPDAGSDGPRGPRGYDEINQAKTAGNFGWPYFIANNLPYADVNFETGEAGAVFDVAAPINESPNNTGEKLLPPPTSAFLYYPYSDSNEAATPGYYRLEATYTDRGAGAIPSLSASTILLLRQRAVEAESADEIQGPQVLGSGNASGGKFIGAINHGHFLRFRNIAMDDVGTVTLRLASAGSGGQIEVRLDEPDGELVASTDVEVNGQWEEFYDRRVELKHSSGRHDVIIQFVHPQKAGGLMNLDSVQFQR